MNAHDAVSKRVSDLLGRPARWASAERAGGDYDGRERTIEVFNADAAEQRDLVRALRSERRGLETAVGGPLVLVFHTRAETQRLYSDVIASQARHASS